ncbi:hypothetical protein FEMY_23510 [Ferrovum myxofaciens]|jgi:hypothetical protein|uniref:Uncharacterized protein n=1 Tax=Ferrovum myxofaciens TaxID=416213 RepID=A0A149VV87_9PROT|nr:DUF5677 domain-containing protein [Ferrovum myxofaciens]KXW57130.1 hypothetical protein FEMY_23510 [Ferrovum myxofaciens]
MMPAHVPNLSIRKNFAPWFEVSDSFNNLGMRLLGAVDPSSSKDNNQQMHVVALYLRTLTSFQAVCVLTERGMLADARVVVRAAIETAIVLFALVKDASVCDQLLEKDYWQRLKLGSVALNDPEYLAQTPSKEIEIIEAAIQEIKNKRPNLKSSDPDPVNVADLAKKAGVTSYYNVIFRWTSGDATHTSLAAIKRHCIVDSNNEVTGLKYEPDVTDLPATLHFAMLTLDLAVGAVYTLFNLTQFNKEQRQCMDNLQALGIPPSQYKFKP